MEIINGNLMNIIAVTDLPKSGGLWSVFPCTLKPSQLVILIPTQTPRTRAGNTSISIDCKEWVTYLFGVFFSATKTKQNLLHLKSSSPPPTLQKDLDVWN